MTRISDRLGRRPRPPPDGPALRGLGPRYCRRRHGGGRPGHRTAVADGTLSGPMTALLVLVPLALADVAAPLADAGALSARTDAAAARLRGSRAPLPRSATPSARRLGTARRRRSTASAPAGSEAPATPSARCAWIPATGSRWSVPPAQGRAPSPRCCCASWTRSIRRGPPRRRPPRARPRRRTPVDRTGRRRPARVRHHAGRERPAGPSRRHRRRGRARSAEPGSAPGWTHCLTACTPGWATAMPGCPGASGPGSGSRGRCSPTSRCWSSTSPPPTSTTRPPPSWRRRC